MNHSTGSVLIRWLLVLPMIAAISLLCCRASTAAADDAAGTGTVSGRVVTKVGEPVPGAKIGVYSVLLNSRSYLESTTTDALGRFEFSGAPAGRCFVFAQHERYALGTKTVTIPSEGAVSAAEIILAEPELLTLLVSDPSGKPLAGASLLEASWDGPNGTESLRRWQARAANFDWPTSNEAGRLSVPLFPNRSSVAGYVDHPRHGRVKLPGQLAENPNAPVPVRLEEGAEFILKIVGDGVQPPLEGLRINILRDGETSHTFWDEPIRLDEQNEFRVFLQPGQYRAVLLRHPDLQTHPGLYNGLQLTTEKPTRFEIRVTPRSAITGRVIHAGTGKPLRDRHIEAYVYSPDFPADEYGLGPGWYLSQHAFSDSEGRYTIHAGVGRVRLLLNDEEFVSERPFLEIADLKADKPFEAPDFALFNFPTITGQVRRPDGSRVPHAVCKPIGAQHYRHPSVADEHGRINYQVQEITAATELGEPGFIELQIFDPLGPFERRVKILLDPQKPPDPLAVVLDPAPIGRPPEPGETAVPDHVSLRGNPAPELNYQATFNSDGAPIQLAHLRGKHVLLYFWATWCGPCRRTKPTVEAASKIFGSDLAVIGVHHNSVAAPDVQAFIDEQGPRFPVVLDSQDGSICREYGVQFYPTCVLIDPDGQIVLTSNDHYEAMKSDLFATLRSYLAGPQAGTEETRSPGASSEAP